MDGAPITIFKRGQEYPQTLVPGHTFGPGFALEWSSNGLLSGDHDGNIAYWKDIEQNPEKF